MTKPIMDEDLRERKLVSILDVLVESNEPLTVGQIQYRLGRDRGEDMSRDEIEAHLRWGLHQPNATNAPVRPIRESKYSAKWIAVYKHPPTARDVEAAGPPPFVRTVTTTPEGKRIPGRVSQDFLDKIQSGEVRSYVDSEGTTRRKDTVVGGRYEGGSGREVPDFRAWQKRKGVETDTFYQVVKFCDEVNATSEAKDRLLRMLGLTGEEESFADAYYKKQAEEGRP